MSSPMSQRRSRMMVVPALLLLAGGLAPAQEHVEELLSTSVEIQIIASERETSASAITEWSEERDGYFTYRSLERVVVRVPHAELGGLRGFLDERGDEVVAYNPSTADLRDELRGVEAAIASRSEALDRILAYLEESDVEATLAFERELRSLSGEIEHYVGRRRVLLNRAAYATVEVFLSSRERSIPTTIPSSFAWINSIDLYGFLDELSQGGRP